MLFSDVHLLMGRIFARLNSGGNEEFIQLPDGRRRTYDDLSDHYNEIFYHPDHNQDIRFQMLFAKMNYLVVNNTRNFKSYKLR